MEKFNSQKKNIHTKKYCYTADENHNKLIKLIMQSTLTWDLQKKIYNYKILFTRKLTTKLV